MIPKPTIKILLSLFFLAIINKGVNAQITLLQDYKNNYSAPIGTFQNIKFREGGFSGIYPIPNTNGKEFWVISDRGVNIDAANANPSLCRPTYDKIYGFPNYAPKIHRIKLNGDSIQILKTITMKRPGGTNATGLLNPTGYGSTAAEVVSTDTVLNCANFNLKTAGKDIWGIDAEGIVVDRDGNFWICEEGGPTIWKLDPNGIVIKRFTPFANKSGSQSIDVYIDSCFGYRKNNRGFEGLSITPNGKIYAMIQSPLLYPNVTIGEASRVHRLLEIDPSTNSTRMLIYLNDGVIGSGGNQIRLKDWKIGDMAAVNDSTFLIIEHAVRGTTDRKNIYTININGATAVNSGLYSGKTIEALIDSAGLVANAIKPVKKKLFMDLLANGWPTVLDKPEGLAIINDSTIAVCNDNDFQQVSVPQDGIAVATTNLCHVFNYGLKGSNKLANYRTLNSTQGSKVDYSFVVLGCNRAEDVDSAGNPSTANVYQLNRMFKEVSLLNPLPKYLFFAGDMVLGYEADTVKLAKQLTNWLSLYQASPLFNTSVQLVAIEGNHETQNKAAGKKSFVAAERTFVRMMKNYIPGSNGPAITGLVAGTDSLTTDQSKLTYSFDYKDDHFVIVNTDPVGRDGIASYKWISNDIRNARAKGARHIFGIGHKPAYTGHYKAVPDGLDNNKVQRDSFWNAMEKYQADAFFSAHMHVSDTIQPHKGKTWQIIAGNGGSLVEPTFASAPNGYFGYVIVNVFANDSVNVLNMGRDANMTAGNYIKPAPENPTTIRSSYNINVNPVINHTPLVNTLTNGPFTVVASIKDNIAVVNSQLNYSVNGISKTALLPVIAGNVYTFTIPAQADYGLIKYNIQANDVSSIKIYSTGSASKFNTFSYGPLSQTGPSTAQIPYVEPIAPGVKTTAILSAGDSISGYKMCGIPDGLGAYDNGNGTFTLLMNHEIVNSAGIVRAHGSKGAFVSKWVINKADLKVLSGGDLIKNVNLWDTASKSYKTYNLSNPSTLAAFGRFCAADLPPVSAFYNSATSLGTQERIFMNGEETNDESRAIAHIATGANAGTSYELPALGKAAWENAVANPATGDKTVVGLMNDGTDGQVYFYIGTKTNTGTEIDKAGLSKGKPWGVQVSGFAAERTSTTSNIALPASGTRFSLIDLGSVENITGTAFNTKSNTLGVTKFSRPEDGAWDPSHPEDFYFNTTDQIDQVKDGIGSQIGRSRVWRLRFDDVTKPELGGTIEAVLDGTEGQNMLDNMVIDKFGHILLQEDVGNSAHNGKIYQYTIATDQLKLITKHDATKFGDIGVSATAPFSQDEETSGIIDMNDILGPGMFLTSDQAHYSLTTELYEGGQLVSLFNPETYNSFKGAGPSTTQIPYVEPAATGVKTTSILSVGDSISGYKMCGIPDGLGAFDNGNGTFTLVMNHEFGNTVGINRAHGAKGAFVSKWIINKSDLKVISGGDLMKNVNLWDTASKTYKTYNLANPSTLTAFSRFCSADLPPVSAFYNSTTGNGTQERIFMNGEENNDESRALAHIITGANGGTSYELPYLGKAAWENAVASPATGDKTVVALTNDGTDGQVYFYIGTKTNTGTEIDKAGLSKGKPWGVSVTGFAAERTSTTSNITLPEPGTRFGLIDLGSVENMTGVALNTKSNTLGITKFSRPEDGAWDPSSPRDFYFVTTDQIDQVKDGVGTQIGRSRLWRLRFDDITKPELGGSVEAVLDGTEGQVMMDNMTIDKFGHVLMQEDVGNSVHNGKIWQYTIGNDQLKLIAKHDVNKFGDIGISATSPFNVDEESSGIIDAQDILGAGIFLMVDQAHYSIPGELAEGGQLLTLFNPETYNNANGAGPSSSNTPYILPASVGVKTTAILSAGDAVGTYKMAGIPDGLGAFDNGNGTFTLLMNHEIINSAGVIRAHGSKGAFVSKWIINKSDLKVVSGSDLIKNVKLWNGNGYNTYNTSNPSSLAALGRFCAADLPLISAFYNSASGLGTMERIFMNGEETNDESRAFAHIVTGPNAGTSYELPFLGKGAWENAIACPASGVKTLVALTNDGTDGQVYFYIGTKTNSGTEVDKAGLTKGKPWGVLVTGFAAERTSTTSNIALPAVGTRFSLTDLGSVENMTGAAFNTASNTAGVTKFSRPEDGAWDPSNPRDFYFNTTDQIDQVKDGVGTQIGRSRVWRLRFDDVTKPELGGTIEAVLDGTEGQNMLDNMVIDKFGHIMLQEDVGNQQHNGKIWQYTIATDQLKMIAKHDASKFGDVGLSATAPYNQDEETSGIIDMQDILGPGMFLTSDQAHYALSTEIYEGGQLLSLFNPDTYNSNPEINVSGNRINILSGKTATGSADNTDFGSLNINTSATKTFVIKNAGPGSLSINSISFSGANASEFALASTPAFPVNVLIGDSMTFSVKFTPLADGTRKSTINIANNDGDEGSYDFALQGTAVAPEINLQGNGVNIFNNDATPGIANSTDFGLVVKGSTLSKSFTIQNTGLGSLTVSGINITGTNASEFTVLGSPSFPMSIAASSNQTFNVQFAPVSGGLKIANIVIASNDIDESTYTFAIQGNGNTSGVNKVISENAIAIAPNPFETNATLKLVLPTGSKVSVEVFNSLGQSIEMLVKAELVAGEYNYSIGENQMLYSTGMYLVRTVINDKVTVTKIIKTN